MNPSFWNKRFAEEELAYGEQPNAFFKSWIDAQPQTGSLLLPAEGQGRNAVYAAKKGWQVTAFDNSEEGRKSAWELAAKHQLQIEYLIRDFRYMNLNRHFDAIALVFAHTPESLRPKVHTELAQLLKPNGHIVLEGFSKNQLGRNSGGPKDLSMLFSIEMLRQDFANLEVIQAEEVLDVLNEGPYHQGEASLIRFVGRNGQ